MSQVKIIILNSIDTVILKPILQGPPRHKKGEAKEKSIAFDRVIGKSGMLIGKSGTGDR